MLKLLLSVFIVFSSNNQIHAASFDCAKAETKVELAICAKDELSDLDSQMMQSYDSALANFSDPNSLKSKQRLWLKNIRNNCLNSDCLTNVYRKRIEELDSIKISAAIEAYKVSYLSNGEVRLTHGNLSKIYNLADHIHGCQGDLYDCSTNKCMEYPSNPKIWIVSILKNPETTTLLLLVTASPNCNIQGQCGGGIYDGFIALTITDKLNIVYLDSFTLDDCYSGRRYGDWEERYYGADTDVLSLIKPINGQLKLEFVESNNSGKDIPKRVLFDMKDPAKGFIVEPSVDSVFTKAEKMAMVEKLYGTWRITRYEGTSIMTTDNYAKNQIGKKYNYSLMNIALMKVF